MYQRKPSRLFASLAAALLAALAAQASAQSLGRAGETKAPVNGGVSRTNSPSPLTGSAALAPSLTALQPLAGSIFQSPVQQPLVRPALQAEAAAAGPAARGVAAPGAVGVSQSPAEAQGPMQGLKKANAEMGAALAEPSGGEAATLQAVAAGARLFDRAQSAGGADSVLENAGASPAARPSLQKAAPDARAAARQVAALALKDQLLSELLDFATGKARSEQGLADPALAKDPDLAAFLLSRAFGSSPAAEQAALREALLSKPEQLGLDLTFYGVDSNRTIQASLLARAAARASAPQLHAALGQAKSLFKEFFPGLFTDFDPVLSFRLEDEDNGEHRMIDGKDFIDVTRTAPLSATPSALERLGVLRTVVHEYAHGILDHALGQRDSLANVDHAYLALHEGFAVMMELLFLDKMAAAQQRLGLTPEEMEALQTIKRNRLSYLKSARNHYTVGTLYFWHKLYKREGEAGLLRLAQELDRGRLRKVGMADLGFWLVQDDPALFRAYFGRHGDARLQARFDQLSIDSLLSGVRSDDSGPADPFAGVRPAVLRRAIHSLLLHPLNGARQAASWSALFGWASRSGRLASALADYLAQLGPRGFRKLLKQKGGDLAALLEAVPGLPMPEQAQVSWQIRLEGYADARDWADFEPDHWLARGQADIISSYLEGRAASASTRQRR